MVKAWLGKIEMTRDSSHSNILSINGKPGFGKTTLCTALIHYLLSCQQTSSYNVVFFYFDQQRHGHRDVIIAFRAILCQLLQTHKGNKQDIDITSLLWSQRQSSQTTASDAEILNLLQLIKLHAHQLVLILDGVDECSDQKLLFDSLVSSGFIVPECSIALFSRPTVQLPNKVAEVVDKIALVGHQNILDIRRFLHIRVQELVGDRILPQNQEIVETATKISDRANGMFLWASLLIDYLTSPGLTRRQRKNTIDNLNRLEGLDSLYAAIIRSLSSRFIGEARENVQKLFQWVSCSSRVLSISELQCAIAIPLSRRIEEDDECEDFLKALSPMSGALLEVDFDDKVRFIHLSAREFCQGLDAPRIIPVPGLDGSFPAFCGPLEHIYCATVCFSYLYRTVRHGPLAGSSQMSRDGPALRKQYPFLDCISQYWSEHMLKAVKSSDPAKLLIIAHREQFKELLDLTSAVLASRETISTWIESSWSFGRSPNIASKEAVVNRILYIHRSDNSVCRTIRTLGKLSQDLGRLDAEWSHVLKDSPNEIWEPSISGFTKSSFWVTAIGSKVSVLKTASAKQDEGFICVNSQISANGRELGIVKAKPPRRATGIIIDVEADCNSEDGVLMEDPLWTVRYEIWQVKPHKMIFCESFMVHASRVPSPLISQGSDWETEEAELQFIFPTSLSADLQHVSFLNIAGTLVHAAIEKDDELQTDPEAPIGRIMLLQVIDFVSDPKEPLLQSLKLPWHWFHKGFWTHMSNSGEYLLVLHIQPIAYAYQELKYVDISKAQLWLVRVYQNTAFSTGRDPKFSFMSAILYKPDRVSEMKDRPFIFHPELPLLALSTGRTAWVNGSDDKPGLTVLRIQKPKDEEPESKLFEKNAHVDAVTMIWNFGRHGSKPVTIQCLMRELQFSNDGTKLYGIVNGEKVMMDVPLEELGVGTANQTQEGSTELIQAKTPIVALSSKTALISLSDGSKPQVQQSNSVNFSRDDEGNVVATDLRQSKETGALVLRTLRGNSSMTHETLTRLPKSVDDRIEAALIHRERSSAVDADQQVADGGVQIALNRKAGVFEKYGEKDANFAPTIIERQQDTIAQFVSSGEAEGMKMLTCSEIALAAASTARERMRRKIRETIRFGDL